MKLLMRVIIAVVGLGIMGGTVASCGGGSGGTTRYTTLMASGWVPASVEAQPGDPVIFTNKDLVKAHVQATQPAGLFMSGILSKGGAYEWKVPSDTGPMKILFEDEFSTMGGSIDVIAKK